MLPYSRAALQSKGRMVIPERNIKSAMRFCAGLELLNTPYSNSDIVMICLITTVSHSIIQTRAYSGGVFPDEDIGTTFGETDRDQQRAIQKACNVDRPSDKDIIGEK